MPNITAIVQTPNFTTPPINMSISVIEPKGFHLGEWDGHFLTSKEDAGKFADAMRQKCSLMQGNSAHSIFINEVEPSAEGCKISFKGTGAPPKT